MRCPPDPKPRNPSRTATAATPYARASAAAASALATLCGAAGRTSATSASGVCASSLSTSQPSRTPSCPGPGGSPTGEAEARCPTNAGRQRGRHRCPGERATHSAASSSLTTTMPGPRQAERLVGGVGVERAVPVDVVGRDVEHCGRRELDRRRPVQLEAGDLDGDDVVGRVGSDHLDEGQSDVARSDRARPRREQDRLEHLHRGRLPVGPRDTQPRHGRVAQPPGQLHLAPHGHARVGGSDQQRLVGSPAGRRDHQVGVGGQPCPCLTEQHGHPGLPQRVRAVLLVLPGVTVDHGDMGTARGECPCGGRPGYRNTRDADTPARPPLSPGDHGHAPAPVTHSA